LGDRVWAIAFVFTISLPAGPVRSAGLATSSFALPPK